MLQAARKKFSELGPPIRALLSLYWINAFVAGMIGIFIQIFLYQKFTSIPLNILATMVYYTGIMAGFTIPGLLASFWRFNIKRGFVWSFMLTALSIVYLLYTATMAEAFIAMFLWGLGQGVFWLTVNTFELSETKSGERDFYSSVLNAGNQILSLVGPASGTLLVWLSGSVFHIGTYTLLFIVAPIVYFLGFFSFSRIRDYRPARIEWADVVHFFTDRRNQAAQLYTLGTGIQQTLGITVPPLVILFILGTALRVGIYNTVFAVFSAFCVLLIAQYRTESNRLKIYGATTLCIMLVTIWFGYAFTFGALVLYTIATAILSPIQNVSSHVIDLDAMEVGRSESDFYATMILRDVFLWIWRCVGGLIFLVLVHFFGAEQISLSAGMYLLAAGLAVTYAGAVLFVRIRSTHLPAT